MLKDINSDTNCQGQRGGRVKNCEGLGGILVVFSHDFDLRLFNIL
jgi:hypothetical protein